MQSLGANNELPSVVQNKIVENIRNIVNTTSSGGYSPYDFPDGANYPPPPKSNSVIGNSTGSPSLPKSSSSTGSSSSSSIADFALTPDVLKKVDPKDRKSYSFMKQNTNKNDNIPSAPNGPNGAGGPRRMLLGECDEHEVILNSVDGQLENVDQLLKRPEINPNTGDVGEQIMRVVNTSGLDASTTPFGKIIEPGQLGIINDADGQIQVVAAGRWTLWNPRVQWVKVVNLTELPIIHSTLHIIRVGRGEYGLAMTNGKPEILAEGIHVRNSRLFQHLRNVPANQKHIRHETINIIICPAFEYVRVTDNNVAKILRSGVYVVDSLFFAVQNFVAIDSSHIDHHNVHIIRVPQGKLGLITVNNKYALLHEGAYFFNSQSFNFGGLKDLTDSTIVHGTIKRFRIRNGELGLAWNEQKPIFLEKPDFYEIDSPSFSFLNCVPATEKIIELGSRKRFIINDGEIGLAWHSNKPIFIEKPDIYEIDDPNFKFEKCIVATEKFVQLGSRKRFIVNDGEVGLAWHNNRPIFIEKPDIYEIDSINFTFVKCVTASEKQVILGSRKRVIVYDGEVGISYVGGKLEILHPKTHIFDDADRIFLGFMTTRQQSLPLIEDQNAKNDQFIRCDTKDFVEVGIKACVFYKVTNPEKSWLSVGDEKALAKLVKETSIATLQSIMRSSGLNQVAQSKHVHAAVSCVKEEESAKPDDGASAPLFFDKVHDEFIFHLADSFSKSYGVEIANIRIESFKIMNNALADNISQQAIITAQTETKLANLEGQREIATAEMEREAEVTRIKTQAAAKQMATEAAAKNENIVADARAKAAAAKIVAQGEADALLIKAEAEAKAIELKAAAERKRAEELSATPLGEKLAIMNVQAQMVTQSMQGVQKANLSQTPIQLFGGSMDDSSFANLISPTTPSASHPPSKSQK